MRRGEVAARCGESKVQSRQEFFFDFVTLLV